MRLYHHPLSTNARRCAMTAVHLRVLLELVFVDLANREQHQPRFLALNPNHKVPVLEDDGFILWESYAIVQYLADKTPGQRIYPLGTRARADVNRWLFWCAQHFSPAYSILDWENHVKGLIGLGGPEPAQVKRGEQQLGEFAGILDAHLADRDWICGDALSLADLAIAAPLADTERARLPVTHLGNLQRWFSQVRELDAWKMTEPA